MKKWSTILFFAICFLIGILIGVFNLGEPLFASIRGFISEANFFSLVLLLLSAVIFYYLHIILHEAGHLIMGKLSGYRFVSFRVFNLMLVRENGKLKRKRFTVVGTGGQCLMSPPEMKHGTFPLVLYNLGGALMNFLFGALCLWLFLLLPMPWSAAFLVSAVIGLFSGLVNIIPLKVGGVPNDGYNLFLLGREKNTAARQAFWLVLRANAMLASGIRARDFPASWFDGLDLDQLADPMMANLAAMRYNYLLDQGAFQEARALARRLLDTPNMLELFKNEMRCELLFFELIFECREDEIKRLYTADLKAYINATSAHAARQRLLYAYARLFLKDAAQGLVHLALFHKACAKSASLGEIPGEQELIAYIDQIAQQRTDALSAATV